MKSSSLENNVRIVTLLRVCTPHPHPHPGICYLRLQLHGSDYGIPPPTLPVQIPSFISIAFVLEVPEEALTCSLRGAARIRTLPLAGVPPNLLGLADGHALVPLPFFPPTQAAPSWRGFRVRGSVHAIPRMCRGTVPTIGGANYLFYCLPSTASEMHFCNFPPRLLCFRRFL